MVWTVQSVDAIIALRYCTLNGRFEGLLGPPISRPPTGRVTSSHKSDVRPKG